MRLNRFILSYVTSFLLIVFVGCDRTTNLAFEDFDKNDNDLISYSEFEEVFTSNYYDDWNQKEDEYLDDEDFYLSVYGIWDLDDDELLSEAEWIEGYDYYYGDYIIQGYDAIDIDGDGFIEYVEYKDVLDGTKFFVDWDVDASEYLSEDELAQGVFNIWDLDGDNMLDNDEFYQFDSYYLDI